MSKETKNAAKWFGEHGYEFDKQGIALATLAEYFDKRHALLLQGEVGAGKSFFFETLSRYLDEKWGEKIEIKKMMDISLMPLDKLIEWLDEGWGNEIVFDDIGSEVTSNNFGSKYDYLPIIVEKRLSSKAPTHFTTNLTDDELASRYGARVVDRMKELAIAVTFAGPSRRKVHTYLKKRDIFRSMGV